MRHHGMLFLLECPGGAEHQPGAGVRVKEEFIEVVQRITGRTVRVFLSAARPARISVRSTGVVKARAWIRGTPTGSG